MKKSTLLLTAFCALCLMTMLDGCSTHDWLDWKAQNQLWLEQNKTKEGIKVTDTGLQYRVIADPNPFDAHPSQSSIVTCDYIGKLITGARFDGGTSSFNVSSMIAGFAEGIKKIHCHGDIEIFIPYELGYNDEEQGTEGTSSYIPPYSTLIFTVHLRAVQ